MRLLANENFPGEAIDLLKREGHDVVWIRESSPGIPGTRVIQIAQEEGRVLITLDKDFGELAFRYGLSAESGVILYRISIPSAGYLADKAAAALAEREDWSGHFSVIEEDRIRMTPLRTPK